MLLAGELAASLAEGRDKRVAAPGTVLPFNLNAKGTPKHWNEVYVPLYWHKRLNDFFQPVPGAVVDIGKPIDFNLCMVFKRLGKQPCRGHNG